MATQEVKKTPTRKKDTPGLLMSIIRTLSIGADVHQRQQEKARLEKAYKECDQKLNNLVQEHMTDLTSIMQAFSTISTRITTSQERIRAIKDNLQSCKNLLHCKRDELRKLWIEGIQHKTIVAMLDQIEQVKDVGGKLQGYIDKKQYLHATQLFVSSFCLLEGDLSEVDALRDVKAELISKKEELYELLVEELHRQIYIKSTSGVVKGFQRHGSLRSSAQGDKMAAVKATVTQQSTEADLLAEQNLKRLTTVNLDRLVAPRHITEDLDTDPEMDVVHFIAVLVESLAMLKKLPEAVESLLSRIRPGLLAIVQRSSQQVADNAYLEGENITQLYQPHFLLELLQLIFQQFRIVARTHQVVLANMQRVKNTNPAVADIQLYDTVEVWVKTQAVLQLLLSDYLDIRNTTTVEGRSRPSFDEPTTEVATYFTRKIKAKPKKFALFRFDASSHAISMSSYMREQRQEFYGLGEALGNTENTAEAGKAQFVCKPAISNITTIYNPLKKFMGEIEKATNTSPGTCTLQGFVTEFIENIYLGHVMYSIQSNIDITTKGFDCQKAIIDLRTQRELMLAKPLLQSTVSVVRNISELQNLMRDLPDYADQFLNMICKILQDYKETCQASYKGIVQSETDDKRVISAIWAKDEDINRFLRCLPNWRNLKEDTVIEEQMSEEDLRAMNSKESAILTSNLSAETLICEQEIITDVLQLRTLANLCESLEWFAGHISSLADQLSAAKQQKSQFVHPGGSMIKVQQPLPPVSEKTLKIVRSLAEDFQAESEVCLIVLHLEVRVHCFFHLIPLAKQQSNYCNAIDDMDPDFNVIKLNKDLANVEDTLQQSLQVKRFKYVFEGLGHLVSTILINCTLFLKRINENGIKKMCRNIFSVQQSLTNITMSREADLDHARQYYELLYLTADEIISVVMTHGPKHSELEYIHLFDLLARSRPAFEAAQFHAKLGRLKDLEILKALVARGPQFSEQEYANLLGLAYRSERGTSDTNLPQLCKRLEEILSEYDNIV